MENHLYNLYSQLVQDRRSIYRIRKYYLKDSRGCKKCQDFWKKLLREKETNCSAILALLKAHK